MEAYGKSSVIPVSRAFAAAACRQVVASRIPLLGLEIRVVEMSWVEVGTTQGEVIRWDERLKRG